MRTSHYKYPVRLSEEQHRWLELMVHTSSTPAKHYLVARVLLMSDQRESEPSHTDGQIVEALSISRRTVIRIKQRFVQGNLEIALVGSFPRERPEQRGDQPEDEGRVAEDSVQACCCEHAADSTFPLASTRSGCWAM